MNNKFVISLVLSILVAGGLGFYGGMIYGKQQAPQAGNGRVAGANGARGQAFFAGGAGPGGAAGRLANGGTGGFSNGEIVSKDATSATLKLVDGGSKIVLFSSSTRIGKTTDGTMDDLKTGTTVMVNGSTNQDGSITATNIQIRPAGDVMFRGRPPQPAGQAQGQQP
ncbi:hypothetical protein KBD34_02360 [Patescibacteria group bacterium]|nr:hypothetical protein [Patescibacteria group bacterium]